MKYIFLLHLLIISLFANTLSVEENYFIDTSNTLTLQEIVENQDKFQVMKKYNFGFSKHTFWIELDIKNNTNSQITQRFYNKRAGLDYIDVYILSDNKPIQTYALGDMIEHSKRDNHFRLSYFDVNVKAHENIKVYIRQYGNSNMDIHWEFKETESFINHFSIQSMVYFFIVGILVVATLVSILFYTTLKKTYYFIYALLTICSISYQLGVAGFFYEFHIPIYLNTIILYVLPFLAVIFLGLFPISFFNLEKGEYKILVSLLKILILGLLFVVGANLLYPFFDNILYYTKYTAIINSVIMLILLIISIRAFIDDKKGAIFYLMSNMVLLTSIVYFNFGILGFMENNDFFYYSLAIGSISQDIFLALALVHATFLMKKENEKNTELLNEYSKLTFIGQTMVNISHQWKIPINNIYNSINHIEVAREFQDKNIDIILDKNLQNIKETTLFLRDTATNQLDFYKSDTKKEKINLYNEINFLIKLVENEFNKKSIHIKLDFDKNIELTIEKNYFLNVLMVLFENSYKLFAQRNIKNPFINIELSKDENCLELKFQDNAQGAKDDVDKIFEKYYSMSTSTGLGLYLAKEIVIYKLKGTITAKNQENGIVFEIKTPLN